jgi:hypothetical protein
MTEQADLSAAATIADPVERRRFVFEILTEVARRTQAPLVEKLRAVGVPARSPLSRELSGGPADRSIAAELAARPDVLRIAPNRPWRLERLPEREPSGFFGRGAFGRLVARRSRPEPRAHRRDRSVGARNPRAGDRGRRRRHGIRVGAPRVEAALSRIRRSDCRRTRTTGTTRSTTPAPEIPVSPIAGSLRRLGARHLHFGPRRRRRPAPATPSGSRPVPA